MKFYIAELAATGIAFFCALLNHVGGCFVWRKLIWLDNWAGEVMRASGTEPVAIAAPDQCHCRHHVTSTSPNTATGTWHYCPTHHTWARVA